MMNCKTFKFRAKRSEVILKRIICLDRTREDKVDFLLRKNLAVSVDDTKAINLTTRIKEAA